MEPLTDADMLQRLEGYEHGIRTAQADVTRWTAESNYWEEKATAFTGADPAQEIPEAIAPFRDEAAANLSGSRGRLVDATTLRDNLRAALVASGVTIPE